MEAVSSWFMTLFESPEAICCIVYFAIRLIYWIFTRKKCKNDNESKALEQAEINDIYLATAQLYKLIKEDKNGRTSSDDSTLRNEA